MEMIIAIIEKGDTDSYGIYAANDNVPLLASGDTEQEARDNFESIKNEQADYMEQQTGVRPAWADASVEYRYDMSAFFQRFPFINVTEFARCLGINPSLMRKYKNGLAAAGEKQKDLIQRKFDEIVKDLNRVRFA